MLITSLGTPGYKTLRTATPNDCLAEGSQGRYAVGFRTLDGSKSRDVLQSPVSVIGGGRPLGKITSGGKYRPAYIGVTTGAGTSGGTTVAVSAAVATEMARLIALAGAAVAIRFIGPPSAAGTVATLGAGTCSAASGTTLTFAAGCLSANLAAGSLVTIDDGSNTMRGILNNQWGSPVTDEDGTSIDVPVVNLLIGGHVDPSKLAEYSNMDTSVQTYIKAQLKLNVGPFTFTDDAA